MKTKNQRILITKILNFKFSKVQSLILGIVVLAIIAGTLTFSIKTLKDSVKEKENKTESQVTEKVTKQEEKISLTLKNIEIKVNSEIPAQDNWEYFVENIGDLTDEDKKKYEGIDFEEVKTSEAGEYNYNIRYNNELYTGKIIVKAAGTVSEEVLAENKKATTSTNSSSSSNAGTSIPNNTNNTSVSLEKLNKATPLNVDIAEENVVSVYFQTEYLDLSKYKYICNDNAHIFGNPSIENGKIKCSYHSHAFSEDASPNFSLSIIENATGNFSNSSTISATIPAPSPPKISFVSKNISINEMGIPNEIKVTFYHTHSDSSLQAPDGHYQCYLGTSRDNLVAGGNGVYFPENRTYNPQCIVSQFYIQLNTTYYIQFSNSYQRVDGRVMTTKSDIIEVKTSA